MRRPPLRDLRQELREFVIENFLFRQGDGLLDGDSFVEQGIIDSMGVLELVVFLEKTYGIVIEDDELIMENLDSLTNLMRFVERKLRNSPLSTV